jgi:ferritin
MISEKMQAAINDQINAELYSGYLYLAMSAFYQDKNLPGFAHWMQVQAREELIHGMLLYTYLNNRSGRVELQAIDSPPAEWPNVAKPFEDAYEHETKVTARINNLVDLAMQEKDHATVTFLAWFVDEQVEEEASADAVVKQLKLIGGEGNGLFMIDRELGTRVFTPPQVAVDAGLA